jgi:hypothetical protein
MSEPIYTDGPVHRLYTLPLPVPPLRVRLSRRARATVRRAWRRIRGSYGSRITVTCGRPWSREDRKQARLAAVLLDAQALELERKISRRVAGAMLYGDPTYYERHERRP